ncbi:MAG: hypothetical protein VB087_02030 [Candidatus Limiplasma sp.]|nr:hypothetical protein [Candidatus Limiplasma sp.]
MSVLIMKALYIFFPKEEKGKFVAFVNGKNVITTASVDGNNMGKTTILKCIYHTLGADCKFDAMWPVKDVITIVIADVNGNEYQFYRHDKLHRVYHASSLLYEATHKHDLGAFLEKQFGLAVYLPNRSGQELELAPPAYSYVLNYLDKPTGPYFSSFEGMGEYPAAKETVIYNHLGAFDASYYHIKREHEQLTSEKSKAEEKLAMLQGMISRISSEIIETDYSSNMVALQQEVDSISRTYSQLVSTMSKLKRNIVDLSNKRITLQKQLDDLHTEQRATVAGIEKMNTSHQCPRCQSVLDDLGKLRAIGYNQQAAMLIMHDELDFQIIELNRMLENLQMQYKEKLAEVNRYKSQLQNAQNYSHDLVRQEGAIQIRDEFVSEADALFLAIEGLKEKLKALDKDLRVYQTRIRELNDEYYPLMKEAFTRFALQEVDDSKIQKITSAFVATENNMRLVTLIWLYTLLRLKAKYNPSAMVLPILIDSPSYGELDDAKEDELWKFLFTLPMPNAQLIITKLSFPESLRNQYSVENVIHLQNQKYQMLNSEDYKKHLGILEALQQIGASVDTE